MCNTVTIRYSCNHFVQFHRSTCRSVIWVARPTTKINKTRKAPRFSVIKVPVIENDHENDPEEPIRGRTLARSPRMSDISPSPLSNQSPSPSPAPKLVSRPACKSSSEIMLRTQQKCGPCQRTTRRGFLQTMRARSELPSCKKRKHLRRRGQPVSGGSPLKHELKLEDLLETDDQPHTTVSFVEKVRNFTVRSRRKSL